MMTIGNTPLARLEVLPGARRVVTVICDSGLKYLQGELYGTPPR